MSAESQQKTEDRNHQESLEEIKREKGGCHCRKFEFEYDCPSGDAKPPAICNCSYCTIQGTVMIICEEADKPLRWTRGSFEETSKYLWNSKQVVWHFCSTCGVILCWTGFGTIGLNARCLDDLPQFTPESTNITRFDGASQMPGQPPIKHSVASDEVYSILSPQYKEPTVIAVSSKEYPRDFTPGTKLLKHHGGCHCRKFEFEFDFPYLDVQAPTICNCSFCYIKSAILVYGFNDNNVFRWTKGSFEETSSYNWNFKEITWHFCPDCGALILWSGKQNRVGVNARCLDNFAHVSLEKILTRRYNGFDGIPGLPPSKRDKGQTTSQ